MIHELAQHVEDFFNDKLSGSGFDCDWVLANSGTNQHDPVDGVTKRGKIVLQGGYHPMSEHGFYMEWLNIKVTIDPVTTSKTTISYGSSNRINVELHKDYIADCVFETIEKFVEEFNSWSSV